jgi:hypothetical protein
MSCLRSKVPELAVLCLPHPLFDQKSSKINTKNETLQNIYFQKFFKKNLDS